VKFQAPRGTHDVLPSDATWWHLVRTMEEVTALYGWRRIQTPGFEDTGLFARTSGVASDVVHKEMYTFADRSDRSLTLRPEGTAPVCRAYLEHGMHKLPHPVKLWYWGPYFRHEAPQAGRYRQFTQLDVEALGSDDPSVDAEVILMLDELLARAGVQDLRLRLSSLGASETRRSYLEELREYLRAREGELSEEVRARIEANPLRAFDSDHPGTRSAMEDAPRLLDRLDEDDARHFAAVRALLDDAGIDYEVDTTLVRGLDYYTRTVFEFESGRLGAQSGVGGGGRYDGLVEQLGGPATPAIGWAAGIERILLASEPREEAVSGPVFVALAKPEAGGEAFRLARELRRQGLRVEMEQAGRSVKGQFKHADRIGATAVVVVGDQLEMKDMRSGDQRPVADAAEVARLVSE
jgi:histidyl-tRNA synthetase